MTLVVMFFKGKLVNRFNDVLLFGTAFKTL